MRVCTGYHGNNRGVRATDWTDEQTERARQLVARKADDATFRLELGKSKAAAYARLLYAKDPVKYRGQRHAARTSAAEQPPKPRIPSHVIEDAVLRYSLPRTLTATLCGDPPPGYSALDRKQAEALA